MHFLEVISPVYIYSLRWLNPRHLTKRSRSEHTTHELFAHNRQYISPLGYIILQRNCATTANRSAGGFSSVQSKIRINVPPGIAIVALSRTIFAHHTHSHTHRLRVGAIAASSQAPYTHSHIIRAYSFWNHLCPISLEECCNTEASFLRQPFPANSQRYVYFRVRRPMFSVLSL